MKQKKSLFIATTVLIVLFSFSGCNEKQIEMDTASGKIKTGIILQANTSIRIDPFIFSTRIGLLKKGQTVQIIKKSFSKTWIGKSSDYWYKVKLPNEVYGWVFGRNIKFLETNNNDSIIEFVSDFWENESKKMKMNIAGKWWSINRYDEFTNHGIELFMDGKYKSYKKGSESEAIQNEYTIDFNKNELVFLEGTSFGSNLKFVRRGRSYILTRKLKNRKFRFKKIAEKKYKKVKKNESKTK